MKRLEDWAVVEVVPARGVELGSLVDKLNTLFPGLPDHLSLVEWIEGHVYIAQDVDFTQEQKAWIAFSPAIADSRFGKEKREVIS